MLLRRILLGSLLIILVGLRGEQTVAQQKDVRSLDPPPISKSNPKSVEVLRVWAAPGSPQQFVIHVTWKDPAAWGLMLADIARHVARAYGEQGQNPEDAYNRIIETFQAELKHPTDKPIQIKP